MQTLLMLGNEEQGQRDRFLLHPSTLLFLPLLTVGHSGIWENHKTRSSPRDGWNSAEPGLGIRTPGFWSRSSCKYHLSTFEEMYYPTEHLTDHFIIQGLKRDIMRIKRLVQKHRSNGKQQWQQHQNLTEHLRHTEFGVSTMRQLYNQPRGGDGIHENLNNCARNCMNIFVARTASLFFKSFDYS